MIERKDRGSARQRQIEAGIFYEQLQLVDKEHVRELAALVKKTCLDGDGRGYVSRAVMVAYGGFCRIPLGMYPRTGRSYTTHHDIDLGILLQNDVIGVEPVFTETLIRLTLYEYMQKLKIERIEPSSRAESGGPNSYLIHYSEGLPIDVTPPMRTRIEPRMKSADPLVENLPWIFAEWVEFQESRGWPWAVLWEIK